MNFGIKFRLAALGMGVALMGVLIVFITLYSQQQATELRTRLNQLDSESFGISEHFKDTLRDVNDKMLRYRETRDDTSWKVFLDASRQLKLWIDEQKPKLNTQQERDVLQQIDASYDDYLRKTLALHDQMASSSQQNISSPVLADPLSPSRRHLFDLGQDLAQAHFDLRNELFTHAHQTLIQLRRSVLVLLGLLFLFGIALAMMVYRDMIKPLRVKLVESQALAERREKLASLGMLAAGVAHEIRNPLTAIKAALFVQKKKAQANSVEHYNVEVVEREILRLERIVNDFLRFARPAEPELTIITTDSLLHESQIFFEPQLDKNNIHIHLDISESMRIRVDAGQFKQVLINLIQNAADSIGQNGTITLRAHPDHRRLGHMEMPVAVLEVMDTGKGISPEVEKRLFDPFFTTKETGNGLGLSIAAGIVQKHGGELQYQTQVNRGTTFGIILPRLIE